MTEVVSLLVNLKINREKIVNTHKSKDLQALLCPPGFKLLLLTQVNLTLKKNSGSKTLTLTLG